MVTPAKMLTTEIYHNNYVVGYIQPRYGKEVYN